MSEHQLGVVTVNSCVLCAEAFSEDGGSAQPLAEGRCCDKCHWTKVAPARLARLTKPSKPPQSQSTAKH